MKKTSNMDNIEIIMELEGGSLCINDRDDWNRVKDLVYDLSYCQGFYSRLRRDMSEIEENLNLDLEFPIHM